MPRPPVDDDVFTNVAPPVAPLPPLGGVPPVPTAPPVVVLLLDEVIVVPPATLPPIFPEPAPLVVLPPDPKAPPYALDVTVAPSLPPQPRMAQTEHPSTRPRRIGIGHDALLVAIELRDLLWVR